MINIRNLANTTSRLIRGNTTVILTAIGVSGTIGTAYLAAKAGFEASQRLSEGAPEKTPREKFEETWDLWVPPVTAGVVTIGAIVLSSRIQSKRLAAAYSVLAVSERAFEEYKDKVIEVFGEKKEQEVRDDIVQDKVSQSPPPVIFSDGSGVICCELYTGRYFLSEMEALRKAQNDINAKIIKEFNVSLDELYYLLGLSPTSDSAYIGWDSDKLLEFEFSTVLTPGNKPCLAFGYNYTKPL